MTSRIFRSISSVAIAVFLASLVLIMGVLYDYFSGTQMTRLRSETELVADAVEISGADYLRSLDATDDDLRITWIQPDGSVTYDNKADTNGMENHLEREEIKAALESGEGESSRYSTTLTERQLYCARRLGDGSVLRLSASHLSWWVLILSMISPILTVFGIALAFSLLLAYRLSRRIVRPLNELDLEHPEPGSYYEELSPLVDRIIGQKNQLRIQKAELDRKTKEFDTATRNMSEGKVMLHYRLAHRLYQKGHYFWARWISQRAVRKTGIEIHPGAQIGKGFFIDHGNGVIIGETAIIGDNVTLYQGVTLGGTGKEQGKRHPTIGNNVMISAGAKILGSFTIGDNSKIGAGSVVLEEVPPNSTVVGVPGHVVKRNNQRLPQEELDQIHLPDPVKEELSMLRKRMQQMEIEIRQLKEERKDGE